MKRFFYAAPAVLLLSLCVGCTGNAPNEKQKLETLAAKLNDASPAVAVDSSKVSNGNVDGQVQFEDDRAPEQKKPGEKKPVVPPPPAANPDWDKKIIKTADLNMETKNFAAFTRRMHEAVRQSGGYVAQEEQTQSALQISNTVSIKVPVANFEELMTKLPADSDRLVGKKVSSQDVTMEVVDTKSRLEAKKEVRERYLELLRQAHSMKDILAVQNEINDIQQEMEEAQGRIAYLGHSAAYSTINLSFYQVLAPGQPQESEPSFYHRLRDSFADGWEGLSSFLLALLRGWPLLVGLGVAGYWVRKNMRTATAKIAAAVPKAAAAE